MRPTDIPLTPVEQYGPVIALLVLALISAYVAWVVVRTLRKRSRQGRTDQ